MFKNNNVRFGFNGKSDNLHSCLNSDCLIIVICQPPKPWSLMISILLRFFDSIQQSIHTVFFYRMVDKPLSRDSSVFMYYWAHCVCIDSQIYSNHSLDFLIFLKLRKLRVCHFVRDTEFISVITFYKNRGRGFPFFHMTVSIHEITVTYYKSLPNPVLAII